MRHSFLGHSIPILTDSITPGQSWDIVMLLFLVFCAIVTPFEIAYISEETQSATLNLINLIVDWCKWA